MSDENKEHVSFRLDKQVLEKLRAESEKEGLSLNTLMNRITKEHVEWHCNSAATGVISIWKSIPIKLLEKYSNDQISKIAKEITKSSMKETLLTMTKEYNFESFIKVIESWIRIARYPYSHDVEGDVHTFVINHEMGAKWSRFVAEVYRSTLDDLNIRSEFEICNMLLSFKIFSNNVKVSS